MDVLKWLANPSLMVDWFKAQAQRFFTLPAEIAATRRRARDLQAVLERKGDQVALAKVSEAVRGLDTVQSKHHGLTSKVSDLFSKLGALGIRMPGLSGYCPPQLGIIPAIPVALLIAGGTVALGIAYLFADYRKQANIIKAVEAGSLTAEEAKALGAGRALFGIDMGKLLIPLGIGIALFFLGPKLAGGRRSSW